MSNQDSSIFNTDSQTSVNTGNNNTTASVEGVQNQQFIDLLNNVKNERGEPKYRDLSEALKGLQHAQAYIPELKQENATLKQQLMELNAKVEQFKTVEDTVLKLTATSQESASTKTGLDEQSVAEIINRTLTQKETQAAQKANLTKVTSALITKFGENAEKEFYGKASELGMSIEQINTLASQSPQAVFKMLGIDAPTTQTGVTLPTASSANTVAITPQQNSFIGKNQNSIIIGATTEDFRTEAVNSKKLVEELHKQGLSTYDLTDPKKYFQLFK